MKNILSILALLCIAFPALAADNPNVAGRRVIAADGGSGIRTSLTNANLNGPMNTTNIDDWHMYEPTDGDLLTWRWLFGNNNGSTYTGEQQIGTNGIVYRFRVAGVAQTPLVITRGHGILMRTYGGAAVTNDGPLRVTGDVTALGDFNLTDTIQFGDVGGGSTIGHYQNNDSLQFSNQFHGSSFYLTDRLYTGAGVAYALSTEVGGGGSSWSVYSNAVMQITNPVALIFQPGSGIGFNFSSNNNALTITPFLRDGTNQGGFSASGTNKAASFETFPTTATPGFIDLNNTNGAASYRLQAALNPSQATTQALGMRFFASAATVELPSREANRFIMTNRMAANAVFNLTNTWIGNDFSLFTVGAAAGGTDYTITFVAESGVRFIHYSDTNGATHYWQSNGVATTYGFVRSIFTNGPVIHVYRGQSINQ